MDDRIVAGIFAVLGITIDHLFGKISHRQLDKMEVEKLKLEIEKLKLEIERYKRVMEDLVESSQDKLLVDYLFSIIKELDYLHTGFGLGRTIKLEEIYVWANLEKDDLLKKEKIKDNELLENLLENKSQKNQNAWIIGGPGSGKSVLIRRWAHKVAKDALETSSEYIPIYIPLNISSQFETEINSNWELEQLTLKYIYGFQFIPSDRQLNAIRNKISHGKAIIFLDAADEVPEDKRTFIENWIKSISNRFPENLIILTSRPTKYVDEMQLPNFERYSMVDFDDNQINTFINRWFSSNKQKNKEDLVNFIENTNRILKSNPLFLTMLCVVVEKGKIEEIPSPGALFEIFIQELLNNRPKKTHKLLKVETYNKLPILEDMACILFDKNREIAPEDWIINQLFSNCKYNCNLKKETISTILKEIVDTSGILYIGLNGYYRFYHPLIRDFFVARKLKKEIDDGYLDFQKWCGKNNWDEKYTNISAFLHELIEMDKEEN